MAHTPTIVNGVEYPSVTTVLSGKPKPWLEKWKTKWGPLADRKTAAANAIGTEFHHAVESRITGAPWVIRYPRVVNMLASFRRWAEVYATGVSIASTELKVISHKYRYAGTFDAVGLWDGELYLFDWKTSSAIYPDMALQLIAYAKAYEEQTGTEVEMGCIVLVSKDKPHHKVTVAEYKMTKTLFNQFLRRLQDYNKAQKVVA